MKNSLKNKVWRVYLDGVTVLIDNPELQTHNCGWDMAFLMQKIIKKYLEEKVEITKVAHLKI